MGRRSLGCLGTGRELGGFSGSPRAGPELVGSLQPAGGTSGSGGTPVPWVVAGSLLQGFQHHSRKSARVSAQLCQPQGSTAAPQVSQG